MIEKLELIGGEVYKVGIDNVIDIEQFDGGIEIMIVEHREPVEIVRIPNNFVKKTTKFKKQKGAK